MAHLGSSWRRWTGSHALLGAAALSLGACTEAVTAPDTEPPRPNQPAIAFVSTRSGSPHIYVADADGSHVAPLTPGRSPAWSWDGRRIAFVRSAQESEPGDLYVIDADGSNERRVTSGALSAAWSTDGRITFHSRVTFDESEGGIWIVNEDGSGRKLLLSHAFAASLSNAPGYGDAVQFPTWSPGGQIVAFWLYAGYMGPSAVGLMNPDGSNPRLLRTDIDSWGPLAWSPDGSRIAFQGSRSGILTVPVAGGGLPQTHYSSSTGQSPHELDWSPDGRQIVFSEGGRFPNAISRVFILTLETGDVRQLIPRVTNPVHASYEDRQPVWSRTPR